VNTVIDAMVKAATADLKEHITDLVNNGFPKPGPGVRFHRFMERHEDFAKIAGVIGISESDLKTAIQSGQSIADIAKAHGMSELFLFKLIKPLVENKLLVTVRGRKGGVRLGRPANEITLLDTIKLNEESVAMAECFEGSTDCHCPLAGACDLSAALHEALQAFFDVLDGYTIADLAGKKRSLRERLGLIEAPGLPAIN